MVDNSNARSVSETLDPQLARLMDEIHDRLVAGESIDMEPYIQRAPKHAEAIRRHVNMMRAMISLGDDTAAEKFPPPETTPFKSIGEFSIVREIGRGGMGIVYEAQQPSMGRRVALKILPFAALADSKQLQRFKNEVRAAAALDHPNIVSVYSLGETDGVYYYAMQLVRGQNLWSVIRALSRGEDDATTGRSTEPSKSDLERTQVLETIAKANDSTISRGKRASYYQNVASLGIQAARALAHAHELGIVHRDIKPANLLLDDNARIYATDFGLASMETSAGATATGDVIGTMRYMPPEQALGKSELVDHRADIYSLGITLYELLSLKPAFEGRNREELLQSVTSKEPERLRRHQPAIPAELETIVMKAIAKDRDDRYATAGELADDLERFVANQPIHARRVSPWHRAKKWTQRNAVLVTTALGLLLLAAVLSTLILVSANRRERELRQQAEFYQQQAEMTAQMAWDAVDRMWLEIGVNWIAQDRHLSGRQRGLIDEARKYYESLIEQMNVQDNDSRAKAAIALQRVARIHQHEEEYPEAVNAIERAVALWQELIDGPSNRADGHDLLREGLVMKAELHNQLGQYHEALSAFDELLSLASSTSSEAEGSSAESDAYLARVRLTMLEAAVGLRDWKRVEPLQIEAEAAVARFSEWDDFGTRAFDLRARLRILVTHYLRKTGRLEQSESLARAALRDIQIPRTSEDDGRQLLVNELQLTRNLAVICHELGKLEEAAALLERTLSFRKRTLVEQMAPVEVMSHAFFTRGFKMNEYLRPIAFGDYMDDQLRLSLILKDLGRPHQAELLLAEAERTALVLSGMYGYAPRYRALLANTYANLAMLLAESRPAESERAEAAARGAWQRAEKAVPQIEEYESGLRPNMKDLAWFRQQFPDDGRIAAGEHEVAPAKGLRTNNHFTGVYLLNAGFTAKAIKRFEASVDQGPELHAYDWLYLALAHQKLGNVERAQSYYHQASEWAEQNAPNDRELLKLKELVSMSLEREK